MADHSIEQSIADEGILRIAVIDNHPDGELAHLANFFFEGESSEDLFNASLNLPVGTEGLRIQVGANAPTQSAYQKVKQVLHIFGVLD